MIDLNALRVFERVASPPSGAVPSWHQRPLCRPCPPRRPRLPRRSRCAAARPGGGRRTSRGAVRAGVRGAAAGCLSPLSGWRRDKKDPQGSRPLDAAQRVQDLIRGRREGGFTLITGANKGLGFETARRLIALGHTVYLGARDRDKGESAARQLGGRFVPLEVTDETSVSAAAAWIEAQKTGLDVLINNAGIAGDRVAPAATTADHVRRIYETNVLGIVRVTHAMLPLLRKSTAPVIVNVSSGLGSFAAVTDPSRLESKYALLGYCSSKAAVTMLTVQYAKALPEFRINAVDPGYTSTDLNAHRGAQTVEQGTDAAVRLATIGRDGPTGTFQNAAGVIAW